MCKTERMVTVEQFLSDFFFYFFSSVSHSFIAWPQEGLASYHPSEKKCSSKSKEPTCWGRKTTDFRRCYL